ncbi:MAG: calcium-binding protein [Nostoc sp. DedQUE12a]|nr:calcium-binding protein [Nostoc sp. DedQUE12a]
MATYNGTNGADFLPFFGFDLDPGVADTFNGFDGNDTINAFNTNDTINPGSGSDLTNAGAGNDRVIDDDFVNFDNHNGGSGTDTIDYSGITFSDGVVTINLATGVTSVNIPGGGNTEIISNFENVEGSQGGETIIGSSANNVLNGNGGNDTINGGGGNDTIDGGSGNDTINGGSGNDSLLGGTGSDTFIASQGNDRINGGDGFDTADYSQLNQSITLSGVGTVQKGGGLGQDQLFRVERVVANAAVANNTIDASASLAGVSITVNLATQSLTANNVPFLGTLSFTAVNFDNVIGTNANDNIVGDGQANRLVGGNGNDIIIGGAGNDTLRGENGNDNIIGDAGNDRITGGNGTDVLTGGTGNDVFNYDSVSESQPGLLRDVINDFVGNGVGLGDQFDLSDIDANPFLAGNQAFTFGGAFALGSLRYAGGILQGNTDFDAAAEFEVRLVGAPALFVAAGNPGSDIIL